MSRTKAPDVWEATIGLHPHAVTVGERVRRGARTVYLRWWVERPGQRGNWKWTSLRMEVRDPKGKLVPALVKEAFRRAEEQYERLGGVDVQAKPVRPVTIGETWAIITDPATGRWPTRSTYRDELHAALQDATTVFGPDFAWIHFDEDQLRRVTRWKADAIMAKGKPGLRGAEVVGTRLLTIMAALKKRLPKGVTPPGGKEWRVELRTYVQAKHGGRLPQPSRQRHTLAEFRAILAVAAQVDPRLGLLMSLGAGLRPGQVARARRTDLDLTAGTTGELTVIGAGHKQGTTVELTPGQRADLDAALTGYLWDLERAYVAGTIPDYPLFPQGRLAGAQVQDARRRVPRATLAQATARRVDDTAINGWFREAEQAAQVPHLTGRGLVGLRRLMVDRAAAEKLSPEALKEAGGWKDTRTPDTIYRDLDRPAARHEAMLARARMRGENVPPAYPEPDTHNTPESEL